MEFFYIYGIVANFGDPVYATAYGFNMLSVWLVWTITAGIYAVIYALKAAGLYTMAKRAGLNKLVWCAFVPFASTYLMGELAGALRLGSAKIRHIGLYAMAAEFLLFVAQAMYYIPLSYIYAQGPGQLYYVQIEDNTVWLTFTDAVSNGLQNLLNVAYILDYVFYILYTIAAIFLFVTFFRRYCPLSYIWMVILCVIIPIVTAMLVYAYRNRSPVDYEKIMAARAEQMRRMQQYGQGGPYGGGPYNNGPYNNGPYGGGTSSGTPGGASKTPDDPFGEFSDNKDPFGDFSEKKGDSGQSDGSSSSGKGGDDDGFFS